MIKLSELIIPRIYWLRFSSYSNLIFFFIKIFFLSIKRKIFSLTNIVDSSYFIKNNEKNLSKEMQDKKSIGNFTAYICQDFVCSNPINNFDELYDILSI